MYLARDLLHFSMNQKSMVPALEFTLFDIKTRGVTKSGFLLIMQCSMMFYKPESFTFSFIYYELNINKSKMSLRSIYWKGQ
jgi:hypothetical protein